MKDPRFTQLAKVLVQHSMRVNGGDKVLVEAFDIPSDFVVEMIRRSRRPVACRWSARSLSRSCAPLRRKGPMSR
jgi:leucyl aminopeptidase (aminopeptidase T)